MKNVLPIKPCLAQKNLGVLHGECRQQILYLVLMSKCLSDNSLYWHTEKFKVSKIVESGRSKPKLQIKAVKKAFHVCIWKTQTTKYPTLGRRAMAMWKLIECDVNTFYLLTYYRKMGYHGCWLFFYYKSLKCTRVNGRRFLLSIG